MILVPTLVQQLYMSCKPGCFFEEWDPLGVRECFVYSNKPLFSHIKEKQ